jgi:hypothetical protein
MNTEIDNENIENNGGEQETQQPTFQVRVADDSEKEVGQVIETAESQIIENTVESLNTEEEGEEDSFEFDESDAFEIIKKARGLEADSIDELLTPKETKKLTPEVEKFLEFQEKTGNTNYNDFLATQRDWKSEDPNNVLKEMLRVENPTLTDKEIDFLFKENYTYDEEYSDESEVMRKSIKQKTDLQKAYGLLEKRKEEYMVHRGSDEFIPNEYKEAKTLVERLSQEQKQTEQYIAQKRNEFVEATESIFNQNFEGFKTKIGDQEFVIKPTNIQETKAMQLDIANIQKKFFDNNEKLIDPIGYHKALFAASDPDGYAKHFFELGKATYAEEQEKISRNIPTNGIRPTDNSQGTSQFKVRVVE